MEDKDLWATFEKTGRILDYLNYRGVYTEEDEVESVGNSNRDDTVRNTNW